MKFKNIVFLLLILLVASFCVFGIPRIITIKKIECNTQYGSCQEELKTIYSDLLGRKYYDVKKGLRERLSQDGLVSDFSYIYKPLNTMSLYLMIKKPNYALGNIEIGKTYLIDSEGVVVEQVERTALPTLNTKKYTFEIGQKVTSEVVLALKTYTLLSSVYKIERSELTEAMFEVKILNGPLFLFPLEGDSAELVGASRLIIEQLNSGEQNLKIEKDVVDVVVDLRFKNPVLR